MADDTVMYLNPVTGKPDNMPLEMVMTYVPYNTALHLHEAARVAAIRDLEGAHNFILSARDGFYPIPEGYGIDMLSVEAPSLR